MPDNPYEQSLTDDKNELRNSHGKFIETKTPQEKHYLLSNDTFQDFLKYKESHPNENYPPLLPKDFELKDAYIKYNAFYPRGRIDEWEEEKREQQQKQWEADQRKAEGNLTKRAARNTTYRFDQATGALGLTGALAVTPITNYFSLADTMQDDRRYKKIVKNLHDVKNWQKQNPKEPLYKKITLPDGRKVKVLNPFLKQAVFDVHDQAEQAFEKKHPFWAKRYREKERRRVYSNPKEDPSYNKLRKNIDQKMNQAFQSYSPGQTGAAAHLQQVTKLISEKEYRDWVKKHPEKAASYAKHDPHMKQAFDQYDWEKKQNSLSRRLFRKITGRKSPTAPPPTKRGLKQKIRDWYEGKKRQIKDTIKDYAKRRARQVAWRATKAAARGSWRGLSRGGGPAIRGGARLTKGAFKGMGRGITRMLAGLTRQAAFGIARAALSNPYTIAVIVILLLLFLLFLLIIMILTGQSTQQGQVTVTKNTQQIKVGNPGAPDASDITYTITATYGGTATDIIITDDVDNNAKIVNAGGGELTGCVVKEGITEADQIGCTVTWHLGGGSAPAPAGTGTGGIDLTKYSGTPYYLPTPSGTSDKTYDSNAMVFLNNEGSLVNKYHSYILSKVKNQQEIYADPFLSVIWTGAIEGILKPYFWNCKDSIYDINSGCPTDGFRPGGWQVGYGIQVSQAAGHLAEDFDAVYGAGSSGDATKVQQVGQAVINNSPTPITHPSTFPTKTIGTLVSEAQGGTDESQQAIAILLMDNDIGTIAVAREVAGDIGSQDNWRTTMEGWDNPPSSTYYRDNMQNFSNRMAEIAKQYTGVGGGGGSITGGTVTLVVRPINPDIYIVNQALAQVIGGSTGTGTGIPNTGQCADPPGSPWPDINRWDSNILQAIQTVNAIEGVAPPCNLVKAFIRLESQGQELAINVSGYLGIMQVGRPPEAVGGGSNCDHSQFDIYTTQGNINCGVQHIARGMKTCNNNLEQTIGQYFTGTCEYWTRGPDAFGTTPQQYVDVVMGYYNYLNNFK